MAQWVGLPNNSYKPIINTTWVRAQLCKLQKGCTQPAAASDKVYQLLAHGRWFSPRTPASSTTKTSRHDIAEILLKVALNTINQIKSTIEGYNRLEKIIRSWITCVWSYFHYLDNKISQVNWLEGNTAIIILVDEFLGLYTSDKWSIFQCVCRLH